MQNQDKFSLFSIKDLTVSPLYEEIFRHFKPSRKLLYDKIKHEGFSPYSVLKVRRKKKNPFEVVCGVGRLTTLQRLAHESRYHDKPLLEVRCEEVESTDDESCFALILNESLDTKRVYKNFSPLQFYLLFRLLKNFSKAYLVKDYVKSEFYISESLYHRLTASYRFIIQNIELKYPDYAKTLAAECATNQLTEKLRELKLINYALEKNEWIEFVDFFNDKMKINKFYEKYCPPDSCKKVIDKEKSNPVERQEETSTFISNPEPVLSEPQTPQITTKEASETSVAETNKKTFKDSVNNEQQELNQLPLFTGQSDG